MNNIEIKIADFLKELGVPQHIKGYKALKIAILLVLEDDQILDQMKDRLYPEVAKRLNSSFSATERAMRYAKERAYENTSLALLDDIFGYTVSANKDVPTNSHFLAAVVEYLRKECV